MKRPNKTLKLTTSLLTLAMTAALLAGCGASASNNETESAVQETTQNQTENLPSGEAAENNGETYSFKPSELGMPVRDIYEYPYMGMNAVLTETIKNKMNSRDVTLLTSEDYTDDARLKYAAMRWFTLTEEQKNETVTALDPDAWQAGLAKLGVLGVYRTDLISELDTLTGCTEHQELGRSADGNYAYYLSLAADADPELKEALSKTEVTLTDMEAIDLYLGKTAFSEARVDAANIGDFKTTDINGTEYTKDYFSNYDLTLVNVFATWCSPCVQEMPELQKLKDTMEAMGIGVAGVVYDSISPVGEPDQDAIGKARLLQEKAGLTFPLLMPDASNMNGRLKGIDSFPESFFVDKDGNIVSEPYLGARSYEQWKEIAETELADLKGAN